MLISKSKKFIFLHIPKTAGTSMRFVLGRHADLDTGYAHIPRSVKNLDYFKDYNELEEHTRTVRLQSMGKYPVKFGSGCHTTQSMLKDFNIWSDDVSDYYEFAVVREPLTRLISIYNYIGGPLGGAQKDRFGSFSRFIRVMKNNYLRDTITDRFFRPQIDWLTNPLTSTVHIFKFEDIVVDPTPLSNALGIDLAWPHLNKNKTTGLTVEELSDAEYNFCLDLLDQEYEMLGYEKPERK